LLVVPAVADEQRKRSWVFTLSTALYPTGQTYRLPVVAPGCPRFGDDTVIDRPAKSPVLPGDGIRPGMHKPRRGHHRVVWWDPELLEDSTAGKPGVRRYSILQPKDEPAEEKGKLLHEQWLERKASALETGLEVSLLVTTATRKAETTTEVPGDGEVEVARVERVRGRPVGKAFGTLVHEALASADLDAEAETLKSLTRTLGRLLGNTDEEIEAAAEAVKRALEHPLLDRAKSASRLGLCHRETPFIYREADGGLIEGIPDLVFRDEPGSHWTVVDFKTDARLDIGQDAYRRQVALYTQALRQSTGADAKGVLLYV
jgi:hypothetical protein